MLTRTTLHFTIRFFLIVSLVVITISANERMYGYNKDIRFASMLWRVMLEKKLVGTHSIFTQPYRGLPPHGLYIERIESKLQVGRTRGNVIILKNYINKNIDLMNIINNPSKSLSNISVMFKRRNSYDSDNKNWFYVQYGPSGAIMQGNNGFRLAGRIAKGDPRGCISCHIKAPNKDYVFSHDKFAYNRGDKFYKIKQKAKNMQVRMVSMSGSEDDMHNKKVLFGNREDITYAKNLWTKMEQKGFNLVPSNLYKGDNPSHGSIREVVEGTIDGKRVIVKRNYGGEGATLQSVEQNRAKYLKDITVMAKREKGFDTEHADWFWAKYDKSGYLMRDKKHIKLAGRIAKGSTEGCISCHLSAKSKDLVFKHNNMLNADIVFIKDMVTGMDDNMNNNMNSNMNDNMNNNMNKEGDTMMKGMTQNDEKK